jgi:hypothetical protein
MVHEAASSGSIELASASGKVTSVSYATRLTMPLVGLKAWAGSYASAISA